eukprot:Gregarina_sp_Pseudo_9__358@NODE_1230_length_1761_cov_22_391405_g1156_i0_p1_GENE_NODE_1230_length_1761_cov_22_391405_g1156_i0NODE_1230_length_1761_cov_22_391405_g1156_i0_p1_ORF_typecomplete_len199_score15_18_NODE_1230_length_1761_cov_22_391405_g1156_i0372968
MQSRLLHSRKWDQVRNQHYRMPCIPPAFQTTPIVEERIAVRQTHKVARRRLILAIRVQRQQDFFHIGSRGTCRKTHNEEFTDSFESGDCQSSKSNALCLASRLEKLSLLAQKLALVEHTGCRRRQGDLWIEGRFLEGVCGSQRNQALARIVGEQPEHTSLLALLCVVLFVIGERLLVQLFKRLCKRAELHRGIDGCRR